MQGFFDENSYQKLTRLAIKCFAGKIYQFVVSVHIGKLLCSFCEN